MGENIVYDSQDALTDVILMAIDDGLPIAGIARICLRKTFA